MEWGTDMTLAPSSKPTLPSPQASPPHPDDEPEVDELNIIQR